MQQVHFASSTTPLTLERASIRFPLRMTIPPGFRAQRPSTWPSVDGRLEFVEGELLFMPPCADYQQDVSAEIVRLLGNWSVEHPEFIVAGNEAGMLLDGEVRGADIAVWRRADVGPHRGKFRRVPPLLAVEVAGEDEGERALLEKAAWYLDHRVKTVWLAFPEAREVVVVTARRTRRCRGATLLDASALPALEISATELFRQLGR